MVLRWAEGPYLNYWDGQVTMGPCWPSAPVVFYTAQAGVCLIAGVTTVRGVAGVACSTELLWRNNIICRVNAVAAVPTGTATTTQGTVGTGGLSAIASANQNDDTTQAALRANALAIYNVIFSEINIIWSQISASTGAMQAYLVRWETLLNAVGPSLLGADWETLPACGLSTGTGPSITCGTVAGASPRLTTTTAPIYVRCA
ncbi:hypothetical protein HDE_14322 [Halotydeus destructor]|nr:hypothetical protein HDE_14322 [Halotydeus destructor]